MPRKKRIRLLESFSMIEEATTDVLLESSVNEVFDDAEIAQINNLREIENIISIVRRMNRKETFTGFNGRCIDCDIKIPKERLKLNKIRCIDCQRDFENEEKRKRGISMEENMIIPVKVHRGNGTWQQVSDNRPDDKIDD